MARELNRGEIWLLDLPRPDKRRPVLNPDAAHADRPPAHRYGGRYHLHPSRRPHGGGSGHCRGTQRKLVRQPVQRFHRGAAPAANLCGERWSGQDAPGVPSADHRQRVRLSTEQTKRAATAPATAPAACSRATACTRALGGPKPRKLSDASLMITLPTLDLWLLEDVASCREHPGQNETALQILGPGARPPRRGGDRAGARGRQVPAAGVPFLPRHPAMPF